MSDTTWRSPPQRAKQLGIDPEKVIGWIESGQLVAVNVSNGTRPRWRISDSAFEAFLVARQNRPPARESHGGNKLRQ